MFLIYLYKHGTNDIEKKMIISKDNPEQQEVYNCLTYGGTKNYMMALQMLGINVQNVYEFAAYKIADEREEKQIERGSLNRLDEVTIEEMTSLYAFGYAYKNNTPLDKDGCMKNAICYALASPEYIKEYDKALEREDVESVKNLLRYYVNPESIKTNWYFTKTEESHLDPVTSHFIGDEFSKPEFRNPVSLAYLFVNKPDCLLSQAVKITLGDEMPARDFYEAYDMIRMINPDDVEKAYDKLAGGPQEETPIDSKNIGDFDNTLDNGMFYTKVDNIYVMLYTALMFNDLSRVDHKVSDKVMAQYQPQVDDCKSKNQRHMYGQLNVKSTEINRIHLDDEGNIIVDVTLIGRYLDYIIDLSNGQKISGNDQERVERTYNLVLKKSKDAKALSESRHCPNCGQPADLANTGKCIACNTIFPLDAYDYILEDIKMIG